ncbi:leucine-rich repeat-containing protein 74A-like isoform X2 [Mercenaria mercenaria]|uniref:leucine-rich repeat-containing protein 74A-like isoform X2 n=1 Tax=Mercenaria mercenaria TaxID=6596 RepID=UPI00234E66E9|nr:leucine-rich repeat-containing protein 74A-like isoform X2 [Mercenaria mercenaria]
MTTYAVHIQSKKLSTSNPNLKAVGHKGLKSGHSSRVDHRSDVRSRAHLTATPHSASKQTSAQNKPLTDEDLETVLDFSEEEVPYDETGKKCYSRACQKLDVVPSSYILTKLSNSKTIDCKHYGLGPKGTMALSIALVINSRVSSLNLRGNDIGQKGISYIQKMISESHTLTELNISDNKIGSYGAIAIHKMLADNRSLRKLEMSGEEFTNSDAVQLAKSIQDHPELEHVDLSHNNFGDESAALFEEMISENIALQTLDLSWNQFRKEGARQVAKGLKENIYIKDFNFSWNGIGDDGAVEFAKALKVNTVLTSLDLTCCRIGHDGFMKLITSLNLNESLTILKVGKNNIPEEFAEAALAILRNYPALKLETLDLTDCTYSPKFEAHIQNLKDMHRHINILHGYASNYGKNKSDSVADILKEGLECLRDFCKENNVSLVELFERFDSDDSMSVSLQEFQEGLKEAGVPLSLYKIEMFANALDKDGDGEVDYSEMVLQMKTAEQT